MLTGGADFVRVRDPEALQVLLTAAIARRPAVTASAFEALEALTSAWSHPSRPASETPDG